MDLIGTGLIMSSVICYILALQWGGQTHPWKSATVVGLFVGFGTILIAFVFWEWYQGERAMIGPRLIKQRTVWVGSLYAFFAAGAYFDIIYYLPIYFQSVDNASPTMSGVRNLPIILAVTFATIISGGFIAKTGIYTPIMIGGSVLATVASGLLYTLDIGTGAGKWIGYQILAGVGFGLICKWRTGLRPQRASGLTVRVQSKSP
jgi:MFS transporter, DHA2 family, glioxin efflux transporter